MSKFWCNDSIFEQTNLRPNEKLTYIYLCRKADKSGKSFPSYKTIAAGCGFCKRTAIRCVNKLVELGMILIERGRRRTNGGWTSNLYVVVGLVTRQVQRGKKKAKEVPFNNSKERNEQKKALIRSLYRN